jgi:integrase
VRCCLKDDEPLKFPQEIMDMLKAYKAEQDSEALRLGDKWVDTDRLYVKWNGEPMNNNTPYFLLGEFCEKHDLPFYGLHSFRHLFASLLVNQGVDIVTVSGALGHSTVSTTLNVYSICFRPLRQELRTQWTVHSAFFRHRTARYKKSLSAENNRIAVK